MSNKEEVKKGGTIWRIFKWFGLGLLTALIISGLIFQAPWKVITLLLIVLAACRILPKPAVKWFWAGVGAVVIALIIWVFLPDRGEWQPFTYNFDKELAALEAKRAIPDSENAAVIYSLLLEIDDEEDESEPNFLSDGCYDITGTGPWLSEDHPEIAQWLKGQESKIETLLEASKVEKCRFPINANIMTFDQQTDRLAAMRRWAYLLSRVANNDLGEGRINQAFEKYIAVLQMGSHQCQQVTLVEMMVGLAVEALALRRFDRFIVTGNAAEDHLTIIEEALTGIEHDWSSDFSRIFEYEKLLARSMLSNSYEENPEGKTRLSQDPLVEARANAKALVEDEEMKKMLTDEQMRRISKLSLPLTYRQRKVLKASTILSWFFMPSTPEKAGKIIDASYERLYTMAEPNFDWQKEPKKFSLTSAKFNYRFTTEMLVYILEPVYYSIHDIYLRTVATKKGSQIIVALRRYKNKNGTWPQTLDEIEPLAPAEIFVDPFNNGPFVYKFTDDSFMLYSKGKNNIDEKGEYNYDYEEEKAEPDDWLIWPPRSRKAKEESKTDKKPKPNQKQ